MPPSQTKHITTKASLIAEGDEQGLIEAVFSVFDMIDSDGDVVTKSAFTNGQTVPMVWSHNWDMPIGKGRIRVEQDRAVFKGQLWLDTDDGLQAFRRIKNAGELQEYSWGFQITDAEPGKVDGRDVRFIKGTELFEVSPVLVGANRRTQTLALKNSCPTCAEKADPDHDDPDLDEKPYGIRRRGDEFCVYNADTGDVVPGGCHPTRADALRHQRALMANVPDAGKGDEPATLQDKAEATLAEVDALLALAQAAPLADDEERKTLQAAISRLEQAQRELSAALKRTDPIAQIEPRNQYRRFQELTARHGLSTAP